MLWIAWRRANSTLYASHVYREPASLWCISHQPDFLIRMHPLELVLVYKAIFSWYRPSQLRLSLLQSSPSSVQYTAFHLYTEMSVISVSHFLLGESALKSPFKWFSGFCAFLSALVSPSGLLQLLWRRSYLKPCRILEMTYEFKV